MHLIRKGLGFASLYLMLLAATGMAQLGNSGSIEGVVKDPSGAAVPGVTVAILDPVSQYQRRVTTAAAKIRGFAIRASMPDYHGLSAMVMMSSVAARFFQPQMSGIGVTPPGQKSSGAFRIDHDEEFNQTTHIQYQPKPNGMWVEFNWRYDSGLVAGEVPFGERINPYVDVSGLSADEQYQAGLYCGNFHATPTQGIPGGQCLATEYGSTLISIPAPGTENDDYNPPRIGWRNLFDIAVGNDNLFHGAPAFSRRRIGSRIASICLPPLEARRTTDCALESTWAGRRSSS